MARAEPADTGRSRMAGVRTIMVNDYFRACISDSG